jgi:hypothetical protein
MPTMALVLRARVRRVREKRLGEKRNPVRKLKALDDGDQTPKERRATRTVAGVGRKSWRTLLSRENEAAVRYRSRRLPPRGP